MASDKVKTFSDADFEQHVKDGVVLVDFWAEWCAPCRRLSPTVDQLAEQYDGRITVAKVNIDDNPLTPNNYAVQGIPTLILFKNGQPAAKQVGALPKSRLKEWISANI